jgi:hypothetical protein
MGIIHTSVVFCSEKDIKSLKDLVFVNVYTYNSTEVGKFSDNTVPKD